MENIIRKIDKAGRIVLPIDFRKNLGIKDGEEILLSISDEHITIKRNVCSCRICNSDLEEENTFLLCQKCIEKIKKA